MLDEMLRDTQIEINNQSNLVNNKENNKIFSIIFGIFNLYSLLTKYLHEMQWTYWNRLAGIHIGNNGIVNQTQSKCNSSNNSVSGNMFLSLFNNNGIF